METPLRGRSGGHTGTAPTHFAWMDCAWAVDVVWVNCAWTEFCLCGIAWKNMMEMGRGGACMPARVALQGRIHRSSPVHNACIF
ncbi:hypothetical protein [Segatella oulorum]|uniref:hypothetical protein n=1 Tax=Segatella oulorum TaxID=28136 RepID=UPI00117F8892|nr:hypothetical protein [Segatella oulorum]